LEADFQRACPECNKQFSNEKEFQQHGIDEHNGIDFESVPAEYKLKSAVIWKRHYFPLFNSPEYLNCAEGCKISCKVPLRTKEEVISHLFIRHTVLNQCQVCNVILPATIMEFHKKAKCDEFESIRLMDEKDRLDAQV